MAIIGGALKYVGKKVGGAVAKDVIQHEIERNPIGGQALAGAQTIAGMAGRSIPGMKARGSFIGRAGNAASMVNNINSHYGSVRQGNIRERNVSMNKMASVNHAYEDMVELKKEANALAEEGKKHMMRIGLTLGTVAAIGGAKKLLSNHQSESTWKKIVSENPHMDTPEHRENFEVLKKFSPSIASNKTTARSYLQRAAHAGMMPHEFVKDLTAIEKTRDDSSLSSSLAKRANLLKLSEENSEEGKSLRDKLKRIGKSGLKGGAIGAASGAIGAHPIRHLGDKVDEIDHARFHRGYKNLSEGRGIARDDMTDELRRATIMKGERGIYTGEAFKHQVDGIKRVGDKRQAYHTEKVKDKLKRTARGAGIGAVIGSAVGAGRQALKEIRSK